MKQELPPRHDSDEGVRHGPHSGHDAMLIARLYGGDITERERALGLDLVAECGECAELYADLAAIADATVRMPTPARPRDFTLTEADAQRIGRARPAGRRAGLSWLGLRRSLGGALTALGLIGVVLAGGSSALTSTAHRNSMNEYASAGGSAPPAQPAALPAQNATDGTNLAVSGGGQPTPPSVSVPGTGALAATPPSPRALPSGAKSAGDGTAAVTPGPQVGPAAPSAGTVVTAGGATTSDNAGSPASGESGGGTDLAARAGGGVDPSSLAILVALAALLLGLVLLTGPRLVRLALASARSIRR